MVKKYYLLIIFFALIAISAFQLYRVYQAYRVKSVASTNTLINLNVVGGSLSQMIFSDVSGDNEVKLDPIDITTAPPTGADTTGDFNTIVRDHRGLAIGWSQTVTCTDFVSGTNIIPVTNLSITPITIAPIGDSKLTGVHLGSSHIFLNVADAATIVSADPGYGQGRFDIYNHFNLHVDKATPVGLYKSTITVTVN